MSVTWNGVPCWQVVIMPTAIRPVTVTFIDVVPVSVMSLPAVDGRMSRGDWLGSTTDGWGATDDSGDDGVPAPLAHPARAPTSRTSAARRTLLITPATLPRAVRFHADIVGSKL